MPIEIKIQARAYTGFESLYAMMEPNFQLERVVRAFNSGDFRHIIKWYKMTVDEFDKLFLKIRAARKEVFKYDKLEEFGVVFRPENMRLDEPIRWDINKPELGPISKHDYGYYTDEDDDDDDDGDDSRGNP